MHKKSKIRVLVAKVGLDGHDRGAKVISRVLNDAGMEVIYTGLHQMPDQIVSSAIQEDVDVIGLSILSGAHLGICAKILKKLKEDQAQDILVVVGGIIIEHDVVMLKEMGVAEVFPMGTDIDRIITFFAKLSQ